MIFSNIYQITTHSFSCIYYTYICVFESSIIDYWLFHVIYTTRFFHNYILFYFTLFNYLIITWRLKTYNKVILFVILKAKNAKT